MFSDLFFVGLRFRVIVVQWQLNKGHYDSLKRLGILFGEGKTFKRRLTPSSQAFANTTFTSKESFSIIKKKKNMHDSLYSKHQGYATSFDPVVSSVI